MFEDMTNSPLAILLDRKDWNGYSGLMEDLFRWEQAPLFFTALRTLKREALFKSVVHGSGHIERVMLFGALLAMLEKLSREDTSLLMDMCSYHDTGRVSDWLDEVHGSRSAYKLEGLTGRGGEELHMIMAGVEAHSRRDQEMDEVLAKYGPKDMKRCRRLAVLLKDADGLDRVRIGDLDPDFMRTAGARQLVPFAEVLFRRYSAVQEELGQETIRRDFVDRVILEQMRDLVQESYFERDDNSAVTVLRGLSELFDTAIAPQLMNAALGMNGAGCYGAQCGIVEGTLLFLGLYYAGKGCTAQEVGEICRAFAEAYEQKFGSLCCHDLRPGGFQPDDPPQLCAGLTMEGILFARRFILDRNGN